MGYTDFETRTVRIDPRLTQAERRCTIAHETEHALRGPAPGGWSLEETLIDRVVARRLIGLSDLADAIVWSNDVVELADVLWVDVPTLLVRLRDLTPAESAELDARLDAAGLTFPRA